MQLVLLVTTPTKAEKQPEKPFFALAGDNINKGGRLPKSSPKNLLIKFGIVINLDSFVGI